MTAKPRSNKLIIAGMALLGAALFFVLGVGAALWLPVDGTRSLAADEDDPFMADAITDPAFTSLTYGIQTFLWWDFTSAEEQLDWVRLMGFTHVKQVFAWEDMEPTPGQWRVLRADEIVASVESRGLEIVARLSDVPDWAHPEADGLKDVDFVDAPAEDLSLWANYCRTVAERYRGRIAAYQIWNEPNLDREWGNAPPNPEGYVLLLKACSDEIREVDPDAIIISAGLAPTGTWDESAMPDDMYLQAMYDYGFQQYVDVVGVHAPGFSAPERSPDAAEAMGSARWATFRRVEDMRRIMIENGDAARQMAILETGWTTDEQNPDYMWFAVEEDLQAAYMVGAYQYAAVYWRPWVGLMSAIYISDPTWQPADEQYWWAVIRPDGAPRPAFIALSNMAKFCGDVMVPPRDPDSAEALGLVHDNPCR